MLIQEIKNRITSVQSIRKITRAMELVATSKLQKVKRNFEGSKDYFSLVQDTFTKVLRAIPDLKNVWKFDDTKPLLYVVITGDYGLCGAYNNNILKLANQKIGNDDQIVAIGTKAINHFKALKREVIYSMSDLGDTISYHDIHHLIHLISSKFLTLEIKNIMVINTHYINSITFQAKVEKVVDLQTINDNSQLDEFEFEPNPETILFKTLPLYIGAILYGKVVESKVAETAMRRIAMESATDNADDLISNLSIKYNQARQAAITQEIAEIISGSENT